MDPIQTMPSYDAMTKREYTVGEWALYYINVWNRTLVARTTDVLNDIALKAKDPEYPVLNPETGMQCAVKVRLEVRKQLITDAISTIDSLKKILALDKEGKAETLWSVEALAVSKDMLEPKEGETCKTIDNKDGTWQADGKGNILCIPNEKPEAKENNTDQSGGTKPSADAKI